MADQMRDTELPEATGIVAPLSVPSTQALDERAPSGELKRVSKRFITGLVLAMFGGQMAIVVPLSFSLAVKIDRIAPGHPEYLGYVTVVGSIVAILSLPFFGILSDRTRSRLGRRRPWLIASSIVGLLSFLVLAYAPNMVMLAVGWGLAMLGWNTAIGMIGNVQADRLPLEQRGRVGGLTGFASMVAPVIGIGFASALVSSALLLFLVPGLIGVAFVLGFALFGGEPDSRDLPAPPRLPAREFVSKYVFNPRKHRDYGWNWLGRFAFFFAISFSTTYATFFFAARMQLAIQQVGGLIAISSLIGVLATIVGALGGGFLSDRLRRRRVFVIAAAVAFAIGAVISSVAFDLGTLILGSLFTSFAIGLFSAVDQAIVLDVLPDREHEAGRYVALMSFSQQLPGAIAPLIAPVFLGIAAASGQQNYTALYIAAAVLALIGGLIINLRVKAVR